jgi:predicted RecB family nuclease
MKKSQNSIIFSPSDLSNHISCKHITNLNKKALLKEIDKPNNYQNRVLDMLREKGEAFELDYLQKLELEGKTIVKIGKDSPNAEHQTIQAMHDGIEIIYQARLVEDGQWGGWADFLVKVEKPSNLGDWSYEVLDTKLATETRAGTILQIALYSERIASIQGVMPEFMYVKNPDAEIEYRVDEYSAYVRLIKKRLVEAINVELETYPEPVPHCDICDWWELCNKKRRADDHLGFVAGLGTSQIKELKIQGVNTLEQLANTPLPIPFKPSKGAVETYSKLREQARVQFQGRETKTNIHETLDLVPEKGFFNLPEPSENDIYLDLEGDPMIEPNGLEYLIGWVFKGKYHCVWAANEAEEKMAFEHFVDFAVTQKQLDPTMHIYHYAPYEVTAFKRLMSKYSSKEDEIDSFLRSNTFIDLYGIVRQSIRASVEKYSIKDLEKFYEYERSMDLRLLSKYKAEYEFLLETRKLDLTTPDMAEAIQLYNQDDCISTQKLHEWLEELRADLIVSGNEIARPLENDGEANGIITDHQLRIKPIFEGLMKDIPENKDERTDEQQAKFILAHMLDWYRREQKSFWWEYFRLLELPDEELFEERNALAKLKFTGIQVTEKRSVINTYSFPYQECDIKIDKQLKNNEGNFAGTVFGINVKENTIQIKIGQALKDEHPNSVFYLEKFNTKDKENSIIELAEWVLENGIDSELPEYRCGRDLLMRLAPRTNEALIPNENTLDHAFDWALKLEQSVLPIQGPPGTGKSYTGSHMILKLIQEKKKIGITALSHKVISNLLEKVQEVAYKAGIKVRIIQKVAPGFSEDVNWQVTANGPEIIASLNSVDVIAGTSFLWCKQEFRESVDYLFVDEAGQLSLIDTLAISHAAKNLILLGDPQQLTQPQQGVHPEGTEVSALEHVLNGEKTISNTQGVFLKETWRMHPTICLFDSEMFYENKLSSMPELANQKIVGNTKYKGAGLFLEEVAHEGNTSSSLEEVEVIMKIIEDLTKGDVFWFDKENIEQKVTFGDIKVITPYNAQVQLLIEKIPGISVGTVDKFQGQEAPIIIYSVATSSPQDAPRGMSFLYSPNRFNVAVSRARCIFILVANKAIFEPECKSPAQIKLANPFCRFQEIIIK